MLQSKLNNYKQWWMTLQARERHMLTIGFLLVAVFIIYILIWSPLNAATQRLRLQIKQADATLFAMEGLDNEINQLLKGHQGQNKHKNYSPAELLGLIESHIEKAGIKAQLKQLKQANNNNSEIHFQKVDFDKLSALLIELSQQYELKIVQLAIKSENLPGKVTADIVVSA